MPELSHSFLGRVTVGDTKNQVSPFLGLAGCDQNHSSVALEGLQPVCQIGSAVVDGAILDATIACQECSTHLSDKFLSTIDLVTETFEVGQRGSTEPAWVTGGMDQLVKKRAVILLGSVKARAVKQCVRFLPSSRHDSQRKPYRSARCDR